MNQPVAPSPRKFTFIRRLLITLAVLLGLAIPVGLYLPDFGLRWGLVRGLVDMGWSQASVSQARLSLWKGDIAVRGMQAMNAVGEALGIDGIDLTFRWKPLLSRRLWLEHLHLDKTEITLERQPDGWRVNGLALPGENGDAAAVSDWGYGVSALTLTNSILHLQDGAFRLTVAVDRLEVRDLQSWTPQAPALVSLQGRLNGAPVTLSGSFRPLHNSLDFTADLTLQGLDVAPFAQWGGLPDWTGKISGALHLTGAAAAGAPLAAEGRIELADANIPLEGGKVGAKSISWQGHLRQADGLTAAGTAAMQNFLYTQGTARISTATAQIVLERASLDGKSEILDWTGAFSATDWAVVMDDLRIHHDQLAWKGATHLNLSPKAKELFRATGQADGVATRINAAGWELSAAKSSAQGEFAHDRPEGLLPPLSGTLNVTVDGFSVRQGDRDWLAADHAVLHDLLLTPSQASLARFEATGLSALSRPGRYTPRLKARSATLEKARISAQGDIAAAALTLKQPVIRISRDGNGIQGLSDLPPGGGDGPTPRLAVGLLRLSEGGQVEFRDRSLPDPVRLSVSGLAGTIEALDSGRPDQDSPFSLRALVGAAEMSAQGMMRPFRPIPGLDVKGLVRALELPPLSPYAADALGVNLHTGQLDADIGLIVRDGRLDGKLGLTLSRLTIAQPDPNAPLAKQADMPIETVLDLLRDSNDRISLSIPVRGDLDNPNFDTSDAVNQAIGGALKSTVFTTLKVAFPFVGLIGMVLDEAEKPVLALQSLSFAAGSAELSQPQTESLGKVAGLLTARDGIRLNLCGVAVTASDGPVLHRDASLLTRFKAMMAEKNRAELAEFERDRLRRLAEARAVAVKSWLVDQAGVDAGQLFTCRPRIDDDAKATPRVDLVL
ncbi:DUF748 domain-containing protein [Magnetospirillum sulfuroxidans]|uniref:DUF748 domain-containing protein n=1 Tax=Magnetospirillum sulfuroxidans TaxID=611300 RepID=A0ABS5IBF6_9PROT|nr:DUF748 domain-containing protein [Magnetospirillum sulfuroxidans]MBR9971762.1 DUF748 domain-containing protein [Magnetospirillum sulfuroxidans]